MINVGGKNVNKQVADIKTDITQRGTNVCSAPYNAMGDGATNDSSAIQSAINAVSASGGGVVTFPAKTYIAKNIVQKPNTVLQFAPGAVLKYPIGSGGNDRMIIVGEIDGNNLPADNSENYYGIKGNGLIIDATNVLSATTINGIMVSGAINFEIDGVIGNDITQGYTVFILQSYGTRVVYPKHGIVKNIKSYGTRAWGAVAAEYGENLLIENIYCQKGTGVDLESDVDVVGVGITSFKDVTIRNVIADSGTAVSLNPKSCFADSVTFNNIRAKLGVCLSLYYITTGSIGSIKNVSVCDAYGDGGSTIANGFEMPNNVYVENLVVRNAHMRNYASNGFKCNGGTWYSCSAKLSGLAGWQSTFQTITAYAATFFDCVAEDNNVSGTANIAGWGYANHAKLNFNNCRGTDTRTPKKQASAVYASATPVFATNCMFDGNLSGSRMLPKDRASYDVIDYDTNRVDINNVIIPYRKATATIGTTQTTVAHNLNRIPTMVIIKAKANSVVWESANATNYDIFLTASVSVACDIYIF